VVVSSSFHTKAVVHQNSVTCCYIKKKKELWHPFISAGCIATSHQRLRTKLPPPAEFPRCPGTVLLSYISLRQGSAAGCWNRHGVPHHSLSLGQLTSSFDGCAHRRRLPEQWPSTACRCGAITIWVVGYSFFRAHATVHSAQGRAGFLLRLGRYKRSRDSWFGLWTANRSPFACVGRGGIRRPCPIRASDRSGSINRDGGTLTSILTWTGLIADQEEPLPKSVTSIALGRNIGLPSSQVESGCHQFVQIFNNFHIHMNIERRHRLCLWSKFGLLGVIRRAAEDL
jgi:hypothetical protein